MKANIVIGILVVLLVAAGGSAVYFYRQASQNENPGRSAQKEVDDIVARVGRLIALPEGETPTVATVSDPEKLRDQTFFAKAKTGDKVLVYTNAKKAFLYDPVNDKLLEVAPINIGATASTTP